jgi:hypothetical protein
MNEASASVGIVAKDGISDKANQEVGGGVHERSCGHNRHLFPELRKPLIWGQWVEFTTRADLSGK